MSERIVVKRYAREDKVDLRLECLQLAVRILDSRLAADLDRLQGLANALLRYVETGSMAEPPPPRFTAVEMSAEETDAQIGKVGRARPFSP